MKQALAAPLQRIIQYIGEHGIVRSRDIEAIGFPRQYLVRLHRQGKLNRPARGIYTLPDADVTEHHSYAEVTKRVPQATVCLLSALVFHEITTQSPASVWIALSKGARTPALASPSLRMVRLSGPSLTEGIDKHQVEGVTVRVYSAAKTVADCFKFRNKIGLDIAIEALRDCLHQKKASVNEIYHYAKVCRVSNVIRPYIEALYLGPDNANIEMKTRRNRILQTQSEECWPRMPAMHENRSAQAG